ncbi:MAG: DNA polymerase I [Armatimonadetes bacterium]|nr:DNA polymerase I [Armatimonadota bacterium]MDE2206478.1 DNA polymerase I [Armatimonadota bacterium]
MARSLYIIDTFAQIFRAYYAIRNGMRSNVTGEPTHAVFGVAGLMVKVLGDLRPDFIVAAADAPGKTHRDEIYADYKATRRATPDDLVSQIPLVFEMLSGFGVPVILKTGLEADDIIATVVQRVLADPEATDVQIRILSKDKDLEQLVGPRVAMFDVPTGAIVDESALMASKGIRPDQVIDLLALTGDTSDNVPGVDGVGPKTASQLLKEFGSIDGIYSHLDAITGKKRENLEAARETIGLSRALVTLHCDPELPFELEATRPARPDLARLLPLFERLDFHRLKDDARRIAGGEGLFEEEFISVEQQPLPENGEAPTVRWQQEYTCIRTASELAALASTLQTTALVAFDTETTGLERDAQLCGLSFAWAEGKAAYVPIRSPQAHLHLALAPVMRALGPILESRDVRKCGHNLKFDARVLLRYGCTLRGVVFDSLFASNLLAASEASHKLDDLVARRLGYQMTAISQLIGTGSEQASMDTVDLEAMTHYAAEDTDAALRLYQLMQPELESAGMASLLADVEAPLSLVLARMEANGILCDPEELTRQGDALTTRVDELKLSVFAAAGTEFDLNSPKQLADVLFDLIGFKVVRKTKTGRSTDVEVLEKLADQEDAHDPRTAVPRLIMEYRQLSKLISTYLGNLKSAIDPADGRIHTTFHQLVTATGRIASQGPNLQNIPIRKETGRQIRKAFRAPHGGMLICADYSQIELRILAHLSRDEALTAAFMAEQDVHAAVAAQVFGVPLEMVTREMRDRAKTINFGIIYGVTAYGLARRIEELDVAGASKLIADYKARFTGIDRFLRQCVDQALEHGYVTTFMGRRRAIPELRESSPTRRALGERLAINSVIQGSAADLIKLAMVRLQQRIDDDRLPLKMLLQIHDELVLESPYEHAEGMAEVVRREMEHAMELTVPLRAESGIGRDWFSCKG